MALIKCPECGNQVSDKAKACIRIVCKHMVAVYFAARPWEAEKYIKDLEDYREEEERRQEEQEEKLIRYVHSMKKSDLQETLLQLLFDGPEWQYERFIEENL